MPALSLRSCNSSSNWFQEMFLGSKIAQNFSLGRTKRLCIQTCYFSFFFFSILMDQVKRSDHFSVFFGESMTMVTQNKQMDISTQSWNQLTNLLERKYLKSVF